MHKIRFGRVFVWLFWFEKTHGVALHNIGMPLGSLRRYRIKRYLTEVSSDRRA